MNKLLFEEPEFQGHDAVILEITLLLPSGRLTTFTPWLACRPSVRAASADSQAPQPKSPRRYSVARISRVRHSISPSPPPHSIAHSALNKRERESGGPRWFRHAVGGCRIVTILGASNGSEKVGNRSVPTPGRSASFQRSFA